jgi:hypothetical protein
MDSKSVLAVYACGVHAIGGTAGRNTVTRILILRVTDMVLESNGYGVRRLSPAY